MKNIPLLILCLFPVQAFAGNAIELVTRDMSGVELDRMIFFTEVDRSRMDQSGASGSSSVIFLDDRFLILDHAQKSYVIMDEAMLESIGAQINEAMKEMEAQLATLPPEQREMVRQMMREQMGGTDIAAQMPVLEIRKLGPGQWQSYECVRAEMLEDGTKIQEICSVDFDEVDGSGDVRESWVRMSKLLGKLYDMIPSGTADGRNAMEMLAELDGFPVHAVEFENGKAMRETTLESSTEKEIDPGMFEIPADYSRIDPFAP